MKEEWRPIKGYEGLYEVSNLGRVRSLERTDANRHKRAGMILRARIMTNGYSAHNLYKDGKPKTFKAHRLVAEAFIPNPHNFPEVNHINELKTDNRAENLEWVSKSQNINYGTRSVRAGQKQSGKRTRPVVQYFISGEKVSEHASISEAARNTGIDKGNISLCCKGKIKSAGGFRWKYK